MDPERKTVFYLSINLRMYKIISEMEDEALALGVFKSKSSAYRYLSEASPVTTCAYPRVLSEGCVAGPAEYPTTDREKAAILR